VQLKFRGERWEGCRCQPRALIGESLSLTSLGAYGVKLGEESRDVRRALPLVTPQEVARTGTTQRRLRV
jgi:hypothetical protein